MALLVHMNKNGSYMLIKYIMRSFVICIFHQVSWGLSKSRKRHGTNGRVERFMENFSWNFWRVNLLQRHRLWLKENIAINLEDIRSEGIVFCCTDMGWQLFQSPQALRPLLGPLCTPTWVCELDISNSGRDSKLHFRECGNELLGFIKIFEFHNRLNDYDLQRRTLIHSRVSVRRGKVVPVFKHYGMKIRVYGGVEL
jgi:hypothetical protein